MDHVDQRVVGRLGCQHRYTWSSVVSKNFITIILILIKITRFHRDIESTDLLGDLLCASLSVRLAREQEKRIFSHIHPHRILQDYAYILGHGEQV